MLPLQIRYLLLINGMLFMLACNTPHKQMQTVKADAGILQKYKPAFSVALYNTKVDVVGNHLSGLLLIKEMPDSSTRMVFSNEMGFTFFDFEFAANGNFRVYSIIKKMNKKSVVKTLQHDFELILMERLKVTPVYIRTDNGLIYFIYPQTKGFNYYITNIAGDELIRMERVSKKKTVVEAIMKNYTNGIPDTIGISHKTFEFTIGLKRIER